MTCVNCELEGDGAFCARCGAPLEGAACRACGASLLAGAGFCTACGQAVREGPGNLPWYIAGAVLVALIVVLLLPLADGGPPAGSGGASPFVAADGGFAMPGGTADRPGTPPPLTGTPREQADRLFNRVMRAHAAGDSADASFFLPMALEAYGQAGDLDADGLYHLSVLREAAGDAAGARAAAERVLADTPDHLLALGAALRAAEVAGDDEAARRYAEALLGAYAVGMANPREEYLHHERILPDYRAAALRILDR